MSSETGDLAVEVKDIGKCYRLFERPQDRLKQGFSRHRRYTEFWALKGASFSVRRGETVGIIGQNGSGKSTLLQIIAGTLTPTTGTVNVAGRVTALLELGSGFDPEFTGRENVFVNAAILGFKRAEIEERLDDIVGFAGIGPFLDQPVRTYSSGMVVRLAFAIQAFLPKELLIVDEVLAVGDEAFQRRCFSKIEEFRAQGGTILFVSHGAPLVVQLCDRAVLLDRGELVLQGRSKPVVDMYQRLLHAPPWSREDQRSELLALSRDPEWESHLPALRAPAEAKAAVRSAEEPAHPPEQRSSFDTELASKGGLRYEARGAQIVDAGLWTLDGARVNLLRARQRYVWRYGVVFDEPLFNVRFGMLIKTVSGLELGGGVSATARQGLTRVDPGSRVDVSFTFAASLSPGTYFLNAGVLAELEEGETYVDRWLDVEAFRVLPEEDWRATCWVDFGVACELAATTIARADAAHTPAPMKSGEGR
jgi:lipopolysaccharide transport system ATP-binding protein